MESNSIEPGLKFAATFRLEKNRMMFGIKLWSINKKLIKIAKSHFLKKDFDYIEMGAVKNSFNEKILDYIKEIPVIIHCDNDNVNFAKRELHEENITAIRESQKFADFFSAPYIIAHPGFDGDIANANKLLKEVNDERICIENMPGKTYDLKFNCIGRTYDELKEINTKNYCLDFSHAIKSAKTLNKNIFENIKELLKLDPIIFHINDGRINNEIDEHLNIGEGNFDFKKIVSMIRGREGFASLETPKIRYTNLDNDINNINKIKRYFS